MRTDIEVCKTTAFVHATRNTPGRTCFRPQGTASLRRTYAQRNIIHRNRFCYRLSGLLSSLKLLTIILITRS